MITFIRSGAIAPGKAVAVTVFAQKIVDLYRTVAPAATVTVASKSSL